MIDTELDAIVAELKFNVQLLPEDQTRTFDTFAELRSFFQQEVRFWQPIQINEITNTHNQVLGLLDQAQQVPKAQVRNKLIEARNTINNARAGAVYSATSRGNLLQSLAQKHTDIARAAYAYFQDSQIEPRNSRVFYGALVAAIASNPEVLGTAISADVQAFSEQRAIINTFREDLATRFQKLREEAENWMSSAKETTETWGRTAQTDVSELIKQNREIFDREHADWKQRFEDKHAAWESKVLDLERLYAEKLRLERPARYWGALETSYKKQGRMWISGAVVIVLFLLAWVSTLLYELPPSLTAAGLSFVSFKAAVLIAAGISGFLYLLNLFVKVATSCYHLARDAKERNQLTHVFLALIRDSAIEPKDREIVLSALFSRADTGLLKGDSGPTMPTIGSALLEQFKK